MTCKCPLTLLRTGSNKRLEERLKCARCCEVAPEPTITFVVAVRNALAQAAPAPATQRPKPRLVFSARD